MNCLEVHTLFERDLRAAIEFAQQYAEFPEHIGKCPECGRFVDEQKELAKCLLSVRESVPVVPASLDAAVLASYRIHITEKSRSGPAVSFARRISPRRGFRWAPALALAAVVAFGATLLLIPGRRRVTSDTHTTPPRITPQIPVAASTNPVGTSGSVRNKPKSIAGSVKLANPTMSVDQAENPIPARFQSLMYCDALSCPGAMDVIRVELPSSAFGLNSVSPNDRGVVFADVLVGSDGIARGIRVVE